MDLDGKPIMDAWNRNHPEYLVKNSYKLGPFKGKGGEHYRLLPPEPM